MVRLTRVLSVAALASSATLAQAQQPVQAQPVQPGQVQPAQPGQIQGGQPQSGQIQPGRAGQPGQHAGAQAQGVSLNAFIAHKLKRGNEAEVELGQLAVDRADSDSVKEFAQMMVKAHQQMIQKLDQFDQGTGAGHARSNREGSEPGSQSPNKRSDDANDTPRNDKASRSDGAVDGARNNVRNSESNTDGEGRTDQRGSGGSSQASSGTGQVAGAAGQAGQLGRGQVAGQPGQAGHMAGNMGGMSGHVPHMLVALTDQSCDNELQLTKKMLQKHEGDDFDMAYIGQQIVAHTCMLAHLQALKSSGPQELQQLVTEGEQTTQKHLDHAMKIAKELGDDIKEKK